MEGGGRSRDLHAGSSTIAFISSMGVLDRGIEF